MQQVDAAFVKFFGNFNASKVAIGLFSTDYRDALTLYAAACVTASKEVVARRKLAGQPDIPTFKADIEAALKFPTKRTSRRPLPFPTTSFVAFIFDLFASFPMAVREVRYFIQIM